MNTLIKIFIKCYETQGKKIIVSDSKERSRTTSLEKSTWLWRAYGRQKITSKDVIRILEKVYGNGMEDGLTSRLYTQLGKDRTCLVYADTLSA